MLTLIIKVLLQIATIVAFGYLTLAFFQRLFCKDVVKYNYKRFLSEKGRIWTRFKLAIKLKNYQIIIGLFVLCLVGFSNSLYEFNLDWQLHSKSIIWQLWALAFTFAVYTSHANMQLKIFYDLAGRDPKETLLKQQPNVVITKINEELEKILSQKKAKRLLIGIVVVLLIYGFYSSYSQYKSSAIVEQYITENKNYKLQKDSLMQQFNQYKIVERQRQDSLVKQIQTLSQKKEVIVKEREVVLQTPINYSNEEERQEIYNEMLKEVK